MTFALLTLLSALSLAAVADWFSIIGFMAIYAASPLHALIMGIVLALAKLVTTSWLYRNWKFINWRLKFPLIGFVLALMIATSIGTFGFLSKAHLEQTGGTIDNGAKVERLEQQITREKSVIADDEKVITQLDATINSYIGKDRTDKSLAVRKSQTPQRKQLRDDIDASQKRIDTFSDEKLKLQSEVRKQQLDVGPIRYIAELFYGVAADAGKNIEAAVRIFTLLIVSTLDPLAVILLVAANHTLLRLRDEKKKYDSEEIDGVPKSGSIVADVPIKVVKEAAQDIKSPAKTSTNTEIRKVINEEEDTVLENIQLNRSVDAPLPVIRQPSYSRVSSGEDTNRIPTSIATEILDEIQEEPVNTTIQESAPHFIPQKLNEEEKNIQATDESEYIREDILAVHTDTKTDVTPHTEAEKTEEIFEARPGIIKELAQNDTTSVAEPVAPGTKNRYPTALSWLAEFKRTQNG